MATVDMAREAIHTAHMSREEWLELRKTGLGGSDISALLGINSYKSPYELWLEKTSEVEDTAGEAAYWGHTLENVVAEEFAKRKQLKIQNVNFMMFHPEHEWALANIDRAIVNPDISGHVRFKNGKLTTDQILEVKTTSAWLSKKWRVGADDIPEEHLCQIQWYLFVTNVEVCHVAVLIGGNTFKTYKVHRDDELIEMIFEAAHNFWFNHVIAGVPPEPLTEDDCAKMWGVDNGKTLEVASDSEIAKKIDDFANLKSQEKSLKERLELAKTALIKAMKDYQAVSVDGRVLVTYKTATKRSIDSKRIKQNMPLLYEQYQKEANYRTIRLK